jgi:hypothetical protein
MCALNDNAAGAAVMLAAAIAFAAFSFGRAWIVTTAIKNGHRIKLK